MKKRRRKTMMRMMMNLIAARFVILSLTSLRYADCVYQLCNLQTSSLHSVYIGASFFPRLSSCILALVLLVLTMETGALSFPSRLPCNWKSNRLLLNVGPSSWNHLPLDLRLELLRLPLPCFGNS